MSENLFVRAKESIVQDQLFVNSFIEFAKVQYTKLIEDAIKQFVNNNQENFDGLFTNEVIQINMSEFYRYVIDIAENGNDKKLERNKLMNDGLDRVVKQHEIYDTNQVNTYQYVYVVQKNNEMVSVVGKSSFSKEIEYKANKPYGGSNDLFENIAFFLYDKYDDSSEDKINLSINDLNGNQAIETYKHCMQKTGDQTDQEKLDEYFKKNKEEIRHTLRRLYKKAWIIPIKGDRKNAEEFEKALGNHLEEQEHIFISNKDSHLI